MNKERFACLSAHAGVITPEGIENHISDLEPQDGGRLFDHKLLEKVLSDNHVPQDKADALWQALAAVEKDGLLLEQHPSAGRRARAQPLHSE